LKIKGVFHWNVTKDMIPFNIVVPREFIEPFTTFIQLSAPYFIWVFLHFVSSQAYANYCTPHTFSGYMLSPFVATTPHCRALRWITYHGGNTIENMWIIIGTWAYSKIVV